MNSSGVKEKNEESTGMIEAVSKPKDSKRAILSSKVVKMRLLLPLSKKKDGS